MAPNINLDAYTTYGPTIFPINGDEYIYLVAGQEAAQLPGPTVRETADLSVADLFVLDGESIQEHQEGFDVVINTRLSYRIFIDDFEDEVDLAEVRILLRGPVLKSVFIFAADSDVGGVAHDVRISPLVDGIELGGTWPVGLEVRDEREAPDQDVEFLRFGSVRSVRDLVLSPAFSCDHTLFVGTGKYGVFRSTNSGKTWVPLPNGLIYGFNQGQVLELAVSPNFEEDRTLLANTSGGLFRSRDGGEQWVRLSSEAVRSIEFSPAFAQDRTIFAATVVTPGGSGLFSSTDGRNTWAYGQTAMPLFGRIRYFAVSPNYADDSTIYILMNTGVHRSSDGGGHWEKLNEGLPQDLTAVALSSDFAREPILLVAGVEFKGPVIERRTFRSVDGGSSWSPVVLGDNYHVSSLTFSPAFETDRTAFAGTSQGVFRSEDAGQSWQLVTPDIRVDQVVPSPTFGDDGIVYAATASLGVWRSADGGSTWERLPTFSAFATEVESTP